jgi:hypothetical protein
MQLANKRIWRRGRWLLLLLPPFLYWLGFQSWEFEPTAADLQRWAAARAAETNYPVTQALTLSCLPKTNTFLFGERPQLVFLFSNASSETIYFSCDKKNGCVMPQGFWLAATRDDGTDASYGSDVCNEKEHVQLDPGLTKTIEYPASTFEKYRMIDERTPLPGKYSFHAEMWLYRQGKPEHVVSATEHFQIVDDGSGDVQKVIAARAGRGVRENLELIIREDATNRTVQLSAKNHGKEMLYLGSGWSWWHKRSWRYPHPDMGGLGPAGLVEIPPGETVFLQGRGFSASEPGLHAVEVSYRTEEGLCLKTSNRIYVWVSGAAAANP